VVGGGWGWRRGAGTGIEGCAVCISPHCLAGALLKISSPCPKPALALPCPDPIVCSISMSSPHPLLQGLVVRDRHDAEQLADHKLPYAQVERVDACWPGTCVHVVTRWAGGHASKAAVRPWHWCQQDQQHRRWQRLSFHGRPLKC